MAEEEYFASLDAIAEENNFASSWSLGDTDFSAIPFPGATRLRYRVNTFFVDGGKKDVWHSVDLPARSTFLDLWKGADKLIRESGDHHHLFVEDFTPEGTDLILFCGS